MKKNIILILFALLLLGGCKKDKKVRIYTITEKTPTVDVAVTSVSIRGDYWYPSDLKSVTVAYTKNSDYSSASTILAENHNVYGAGDYYYARLIDLEPGTTYYYYCIFDTGYGSAEGEQWSFTTQAVPTVTTASVSNITQTTATCGGNVTSGGSAAVTARGVCWSTSQNPTISDSHTTDGSGTGSFTSSITGGLTENTTYYVRAYATNGAGTSYGEQESFTTLPSGGTVTGNKTFTVNGVTFEMVAVEGGTFTMGATSEQGSDADSDEFPTHSVTLSDYYIGKFEVTQELWLAVKGSWPGTAPSGSYGVGDNYPAYDVSWNDCQEFITELNQLTGRTFRLPTEAEWEYAARGGNKSEGYKYSGSNSINEVAWHSYNSGFKAHAVGTKSPNELGIYDMSGNVWEWCNDWYGNYGSSSQTNPHGPSSGTYRVDRGGSYRTYAGSCRVSYRCSDAPDYRHNYLGFRVVLIP